eukprot:m.77629 g.77629  ORF g.77629 m.77629 type:complete len:672 (-) comp11925_c0_seq3:160-2175(-)
MQFRRCLLHALLSCLLLLLLFAVVFTGAIRVRETVTLREGYSVILQMNEEPFGFENGGTLDVLVDCDSNFAPEMSILLSTPEQWDDKATCGDLSYSRSYNLSHSLSPEVKRYHLVEPIVGDDSDNFYFFILRICGGLSSPSRVDSVACKIDLNAINPGNEHLSKDLIPLPEMFLILFFIWMFVCVLWLLNWLLFSKYNNSLHTFITVLAMLKLVALYFRYQEFEDISHLGFEQHHFFVLRVLLHNIEIVVFFWLLVLISMGWKIVEKSIPKSSRVFIAVVCILLYLSKICETWVNAYFTGVTVLVVLVLVVTIIRSSGYFVIFLRHKEVLATSLYQTEVANQQHTIQLKEFCAPLLQKYRLISSMRLIFVLYSFFWCIVQLSSEFLSRNRWVYYLIEEILEILTYAFLLKTFRLMDMSKYESELTPEPESIDITLCETKDKTPLAVLMAVSNDKFVEFMDYTQKSRKRRQDKEQQNRREREREGEQRQVQVQVQVQQVEGGDAVNDVEEDILPQPNVIEAEIQQQQQIDGDVHNSDNNAGFDMEDRGVDEKPPVSESVESNTVGTTTSTTSTTTSTFNSNSSDGMGFNLHTTFSPHSSEPSINISSSSLSSSSSSSNNNNSMNDNIIHSSLATTQFRSLVDAEESNPTMTTQMTSDSDVRDSEGVTLQSIV